MRKRTVSNLCVDGPFCSKRAITRGSGDQIHARRPLTAVTRARSRSAWCRAFGGSGVALCLEGEAALACSAQFIAAGLAFPGTWRGNVQSVRLGDRNSLGLRADVVPHDLHIGCWNVVIPGHSAWLQRTLPHYCVECVATQRDTRGEQIGRGPVDHHISAMAPAAPRAVDTQPPPCQIGVGLLCRTGSNDHFDWGNQTSPSPRTFTAVICMSGLKCCSSEAQP